MAEMKQLIKKKKKNSSYNTAGIPQKRVCVCRLTQNINIYDLMHHSVQKALIISRILSRRTSLCELSYI